MQLTVKKALEQGYTHYIYGSRNEFQRILPIEDGINWDMEPVLVEKEPSMRPSIDDRTIAEILAEDIYCNWTDQSGDDDTDAVYEIVEGLDYTKVAEMINNALIAKDIHAYKSTNIKLVQ